MILKIAFDAQPLVDGEKTGVGFCEAGIVRSLVSLFSEHKYVLDYFSFKKDVRGLIVSYEKDCTFNGCNWIPGSIYKLIWAFFPVPYRLFFGRNSDLTHFFNFHVPPGVYGKKVSTVHDLAFKVFPETVRLKTKIMLNLTLKKSCRRADKITTVSQFTKEELMKFLDVPESKIVVVPNGVDLNRFFPQIDGLIIDGIKSKYGIDGQYLLYLGTLEPRKNIERLIKAYALLKSILPDAPKLVLAGRKGWMYESIFKTVSELKLENSVIFTGYIEDSEAPALLGGATAFLFPSLYEGFGMPPLEAMACGTPVLTSNCSSLPEVVGDAAVLVDPYSVEEIAEGMERLVTDAGLRKELSEKGLERAKDFTWERSAKILMDVYKSLVEE